MIAMGSSLKKRGILLRSRSYEGQVVDKMGNKIEGKLFQLSAPSSQLLIWGEEEASCKLAVPVGGSQAVSPANFSAWVMTEGERLAPTSAKRLIWGFNWSIRPRCFARINTPSVPSRGIS